jgi:hypothetical protein
VLPVIVSGYRRTGRRVRRRANRVALIVGGLGGLLLVGAALAVALSAEDFYKGAQRIDSSITAAQDTDDDRAAITMNEASQYLANANDTLTSWFAWPARVLPVIGPNLDAADRLSNQASDASRIVADAAGSADVDALKFSDGKLDPKVVDNVTDTLDTVSHTLGKTQVEVEDVQQSPWLLGPISNRMDDLDAKLEDNLPDVKTALGAAKIAKGLLGAEKPRRYLVLFTTPVEARGRTGFPGNYAELLVDKGQLSMPRFGRITELENGGAPGQRTITGPPDFLARYGRFQPESTWRNVVLSPDFPTIAKIAGQLYPQSGGTKIDGVMSVDPTGLAALMRLLDLTIPVDGLPEPLTADNTVDFLQYDQYVKYPETSQRVDLLEKVARTTFEDLTHADLPRPKDAIDILDPVVDRGHIQFTTFNADEAKYFDDIGLSGRFDPPAGDFLSVVTSNAGANKIDLFLQRTLHYTVAWDPKTGAVGAKAVVTLQNNAPAEGLPEYVIGNAVDQPWGTNRSFVSVYSGYELSGAKLNGQPVALQSEEELARHVYSTFVDIPSGGSVTLELDLKGQLPAGLGFYPLVMQPQPLVNPEQADVNVIVAGNDKIKVSGDHVQVQGRTVHWGGTLDVKQRIAMTAGDVKGSFPAG